MADTKLSDETPASALSGAELVYLVQGGASKKSTVSAVAGFAKSFLYRTITARFNGGATDGTPDPIEVGAEVILRAPYALTLTSWTLLLQDSTGAITVDVQTKPFASGSFASITSTGTPSTTGGANAEGTVTGWTTSISAGHLVRIVVTARTGDVFDAALQIEATQA